MPEILQEHISPFQKEWQEYLKDGNTDKLLRSCYRWILDNIDKYRVKYSIQWDKDSPKDTRQKQKKIIRTNLAENFGRYNRFEEIENAIADKFILIDDVESDKFVAKMNEFHKEIRKVMEWFK
jgi:hypothetical protein